MHGHLNIKYFIVLPTVVMLLKLQTSFVQTNKKREQTCPKCCTMCIFPNLLLYGSPYRISLLYYIFIKQKLLSSIQEFQRNFKLLNRFQLSSMSFKTTYLFFQPFLLSFFSLFYNGRVYPFFLLQRFCTTVKSNNSYK